MFSIKLIKQKFDKYSRTNTLMKMISKKKICDIQMRYNLLILKHQNEIMIANFVQSRTTAKTTLWMWHLRLKHCHSTVIEKLKVLNKKITVKKEKNQKRSNARHVLYQRCIKLFRNSSQQKQLSYFRSCILIWQ
jgi:putative ribosome biogenesis GTPase RsgA